MVFDIIELPVWFIPTWVRDNFSKAKVEMQYMTFLWNWALPSKEDNMHLIFQAVKKGLITFVIWENEQLFLC